MPNFLTGQHGVVVSNTSNFLMFNNTIYSYFPIRITYAKNASIINNTLIGNEGIFARGDLIELKGNTITIAGGYSPHLCMGSIGTISVNNYYLIEGNTFYSPSVCQVLVFKNMTISNNTYYGNDTTIYILGEGL